MTPLLVILMGSKADLSHAKKIAEAAEPFGFDVEMRTRFQVLRMAASAPR